MANLMRRARPVQSIPKREQESVQRLTQGQSKPSKSAQRPIHDLAIFVHAGSVARMIVTLGQCFGPTCPIMHFAFSIKPCVAPLRLLHATGRWSTTPRTKAARHLTIGQLHSPHAPPCLSL